MPKKIGLIVDGQGDHASMSSRFKAKCHILKTDGPRGHTAKLDDIVSHSRKQVDQLSGLGCTRIAVVFDFEGRATNYATFLAEAQKKFEAAFENVDINVSIPNRMIENWYLADIEWLSKKKAFIRDGLKQKKYEGTHGKGKLKKCMVKNTSYKEKKHGAQLFALVRFPVAEKNSPSLKRFLSLV